MRNILGLCSILALCAGLGAVTPPFNGDDSQAVSSRSTAEGVVAPSAGGSPSGSPNSGSLDQTIISEGFDDPVADHSLPMGWSEADLDSGSNNDASYGWWGGLSVWQKTSHLGISTHTGSGVCANIWNSQPRANDDWLILPQIPALTGTINFSYWVSSQDGRWPESFEVRISTAGNQPADFTDLIFSESAAPHLWTQHTHNLSSYGGAPFYVAIHYTSYQRFIIKVDDVLLTGTPLAAGDRPFNLPGQFTFAGNYPNPFNGQTEFRFELPQTARVSLRIYNLLGRECAQILNENLDAGAHGVTFNAAVLPSGVYFARLTAGEWSQTRKMMLLK